MVEERSISMTSVGALPQTTRSGANVEYVQIVGIYGDDRDEAIVLAARQLHWAGTDRRPYGTLEAHRSPSSLIATGGFSTAPGSLDHCFSAFAYRSNVGGGLPNHLRARISSWRLGSSPMFLCSDSRRRSRS